MPHNSDSTLPQKSTKRQYKYAVTAILVIIIAFSVMLYLDVNTLPVTHALNNISIKEVTSQESTPTTPSLITFSTGNSTLNFGYGYLNITNTGNKDLTLNLKLSARITNINTDNVNYYLGSTTISNVKVQGHSSTIISATLKDPTPIVHWTQRASGFFAYSWSVQASANVHCLLPHPALQRTFTYQGQMILF
ncbi:MAG: hypothetical protein ABSF44_09050 [Candidatus Bathyarchaeia archaeon]